MEPFCKRCGPSQRTYKWKTFADGTQHIEETCAKCGDFVRWSPQDADHLRLAGERPKPPAKIPSWFTE